MIVTHIKHPKGHWKDKQSLDRALKDSKEPGIELRPENETEKKTKRKNEDSVSTKTKRKNEDSVSTKTKRKNEDSVSSTVNKKLESVGSNKTSKSTDGPLHIFLSDDLLTNLTTPRRYSALDSKANSAVCSRLRSGDKLPKLLPKKRHDAIYNEHFVQQLDTRNNRHDDGYGNQVADDTKRLRKMKPDTSASIIERLIDSVARANSMLEEGMNMLLPQIQSEKCRFYTKEDSNLELMYSTSKHAGKHKHAATVRSVNLNKTFMPESSYQGLSSHREHLDKFKLPNVQKKPTLPTEMSSNAYVTSWLNYGSIPLPTLAHHFPDISKMDRKSMDKLNE